MFGILYIETRTKWRILRTPRCRTPKDNPQAQNIRNNTPFFHYDHHGRPTYHAGSSTAANDAARFVIKVILTKIMRVGADDSSQTMPVAILPSASRLVASRFSRARSKKIGDGEIHSKRVQITPQSGAMEDIRLSSPSGKPSTEKKGTLASLVWRRNNIENIRHVPEGCVNFDGTFRFMSMETVTSTSRAEATAIANIPTRVDDFMVATVVLEKESDG